MRSFRAIGIAAAVFVAVAMSPAARADTTVINSVWDLQNIQNNLAGNYVLGADIDASLFGNFTPIGSPITPFTGSFDGQGRVVSGLTIQNTTD